MTETLVPVLAGPDLDDIVDFYAALGFEVGFHDAGWMILSRGALRLEFLPLAVDPLETIASACLRVDDLDALYADFAKAGLPGECWSTPRLTPIQEVHGLRLFALIDPDGNLLRCIDNGYGFRGRHDA